MITLICLHVEKLHPSIKPELALIAIKEAFAADNTTNNETKVACKKIIEFSFGNAYLCYQNETLKSKIGISTGGSLDR